MTEIAHRAGYAATVMTVGKSDKTHLPYLSTRARPPALLREAAVAQAPCSDPANVTNVAGYWRRCAESGKDRATV